MSQLFFQIRSFITYWLHAVDAHSIHSPFFYDLYTQVVRPGKYAAPFSSDTGQQPTFQQIESARRSLLANHHPIDVLDLGAGSRRTPGTRRTISEIASHSLSPARFGQLYHRAVTHYRAEHILELGTSLGINTMYLAARRGTRINTIEGSSEVARFAESLFAQWKIDNISIVNGNIDDVLPEVIDRMPRIDFAFLDANHRFAPTLQYFNSVVTKVHHGSVVVLDDIHLNTDMHRAWLEIKRHPRTTGTADLFRCGFVFFDPSLNSQHFVLQI